MCGKIIVSNSEASTMERDELLRLIDQAADEQWTELDLAGMDLTELPPEIGKLTQLETLILGKFDRAQGRILGNQLTDLPPEIEKLTNLTNLALSGNQISEIPVAIEKLTSLTNLDLWDNQISEIPVAIEKLTSLTNLNLSYNQITEIPVAIEKLTSLTNLNLSRNQITEIPVAIEKLTSLTNLALSENKLTEIPVAIEKLTSLTNLALWGNQITEIPVAIEKLTNLTNLDLSFNQITEIPVEIEKLTSLTNLALSFNQITEIPVEIEKLTSLTNLALSGNQITEIPVAIEKLTSLTNLDLWGNQITEIPVAIEKLTSLTNLNLSYNQITEIPVAIEKLTSLTNLNLSYNQITEIPVAIEKLTSLANLNLSYNQITEIPVAIEKLTSLTNLNLSGNQITEIPQWFQSFQNLDKLDLRGNPVPIPQAILGVKEYYRDPGDLQAILSFYFQTQDPNETEPLYEAKFIIVGEGEAGKTTLAKKLRDRDYKLDPNESKTHGINIINWEFTQPNGKPFRVNIWDFGGQEILHATHQFFLTERSLYTLLIDARRENPNLDYWLNIVRLLSDDSPVFIIKNEKQECLCQLDERQLRGEFKNLQNPVRTNLATNRGLEDIHQAIQTHITTLPHIHQPIPKTWVRIRSALENYSQHRNYISVNEYYTLCEKASGLKDKQEMRIISKYLHDLGICLHFQEDPVLKSHVILNPTWATNAVYRITEDDDIKANKGCFTGTDLQTIWRDAQYAEMQHELLQLMTVEKFRICYKIGNTDTYIAPSLLPKDQPEYTWNETDNLILRYEYEFMPRGIITRFIVEMHNLIESLPAPASATSQLVWKNGVILTDSRARAEVIEFYDKKEIRIRVVGFQKKTLLEHIRREFHKIHDSYERLDRKELIPCNCSTCENTQTPYTYSLAVLWDFLKNGDFEIQCQKGRKMVNVRRLIDDVIEPIREEMRDKSRSFEDSPTESTIYQTYHIQKVENMTGNTTQNAYGSGDNIGRDKVMGDKIGTQINNSQNLAQAALEIQALLDNLSETYNPNTETGQTKIAKDAIEQIEQNPTLKGRIVNAVKEGGYTALEEAIDRPVVKILMAAFKGFTEGK
jgi:Leucine-rich repeat (LRR) protein/GTPase SAR1 family protein